jgi:hypothetical protein|tara:strand:+ start:2668 stop:2781 length:114 start_codon:yes stop_codon:yes gene_type:complete
MSPDVPKIVSNTKFTAGEKITKIDIIKQIIASEKIKK